MSGSYLLLESNIKRSLVRLSANTKIEFLSPDYASERDSLLTPTLHRTLLEPRVNWIPPGRIRNARLTNCMQTTWCLLVTILPSAANNAHSPRLKIKGLSECQHRAASNTTVLLGFQPLDFPRKAMDTQKLSSSNSKMVENWEILFHGFKNYLCSSRPLEFATNLHTRKWSMDVFQCETDGNCLPIPWSEKWNGRHTVKLRSKAAAAPLQYLRNRFAAVHFKAKNHWNAQTTWKPRMVIRWLKPQTKKFKTTCNSQVKKNGCCRVRLKAQLAHTGDFFGRNSRPIDHRES